MLFSVISPDVSVTKVPSVKVSLDKVASQLWEWRRVQCNGNKGRLFFDGRSPKCEMTSGFRMDEARIKDGRVAPQNNSIHHLAV